METIKLISWNVNGIRAALKKGFIDYVRSENPDILCIQETKAQEGQAEVDLPEYTEYWNSAERKGYSGTAIFSKRPALNITKNLDATISFKDKYGDANIEGRVITAEYDKFYVVTVYTPNSKGDLSRLDFRHSIWDPAFLSHIKTLEKTKPVIFCGDLNVAHEEIDLARPKDNHMSHGFTDQERQGFTNIVSNGLVDTFRMFNKEGGNYTWWNQLGNSRARNVGWRIDYVVVSEQLKDNVKEAFIRPEIMGSDHCPVGILLEV
jgi:exodeoxyribonuclease-3